MARAKTVKAPKVQEKEKRQGPKTELVVAGASTAWLIVRPISGKERPFMDYMRAIGFEVYQPVLISERYNRFKRQWTVVTSPMFTGFVLVKPTPGKAHMIFKAPYFFDALKLALFDKVVKEIRSREEDGMVKALTPPEKPEKGDKVKVRTVVGMVDAILEETVDTNRIAIVTGLLKGAARVTCSLDQVVRH